MIVDISSEQAVSAAVRLCAGGLMVWSLEMAAVRREFAPAGIFSMATATDSADRFVSVTDKQLRPVWLLQFVAGAVLLAAGPFSLAGRVALIVALGAHLVVRLRRRRGTDGADQMATVILVAACVATIPVAAPLRIDFAVWFIAAQSVLCYAASGVAKLVSPAWRDGSAIPGILSTYSHGMPRLGAWLHGRRKLSLLMAWSVIVSECVVVVALFLPQPALLAALAIGLAFHLGCAVLMGINSFLWAFPATYPCLLVANAQLAQHCVFCG